MGRDRVASTASEIRPCSHGHPNPCAHLYCGECGEQLTDAPPPMWGDFGEAFAVIRHPAHLRRTFVTTLIVGTVLFCINQLDVVLAGEADAAVWVKGSFTFAVPFAVSNVGVLIATHRRPASVVATHDDTQGST